MQPWLSYIPEDISTYPLDYQRSRHMHVIHYETNESKCISWKEYLVLRFSKEAHHYSYTIPVCRFCFEQPAPLWVPDMHRICAQGYHSIDAFSWDRDFQTKEIRMVKIGFQIEEGDDADSDGYGRSPGTFFAAIMDRQGQLLSPFKVVHR